MVAFTSVVIANDYDVYSRLLVDEIFLLLCLVTLSLFDIMYATYVTNICYLQASSPLKIVFLCCLAKIEVFSRHFLQTRKQRASESLSQHLTT